MIVNNLQFNPTSTVSCSKCAYNIGLGRCANQNPLLKVIDKGKAIRCNSYLEKSKDDSNWINLCRDCEDRYKALKVNNDD